MVLRFDDGRGSKGQLRGFEEGVRVGEFAHLDVDREGVALCHEIKGRTWGWLEDVGVEDALGKRGDPDGLSKWM